MKEKFERLKPHVNIGDIKTVDHGKSTIEAAFKHSQESYEKYAQIILQDLINEYGEEEGKKRFDDLIQQTKESYQDYKNIDSVSEEKEFGVGPKTR